MHDLSRSQAVLAQTYATLAEPEQRRQFLEGLGQWYQSVELDGVTSPVEAGVAESQFYNRGKWRNFVEPLLPPVAGAFGELGSNAGLFLLCAAEAGYAEVIGIEPDAEWFGQGQFVLDHARGRAPDLYGSIQLLQRRVGQPGHGANKTCQLHGTCLELDVASLPDLQVMLLSNVLYWIEREACQRFIDALAKKAQYALVVSVEAATQAGGPASLAQVRQAFAEHWEERGLIANVDQAGDSAPRRMFSVLFESRA